MGNRYSFTTAGLRSVELSGISADEVYEVLHAPAGRRLIRHLSGGAAVVYGVNVAGRGLVVGLQESVYEDCDWDIVAAREADTDERDMVEHYLRGKHD